MENCLVTQLNGVVQNDNIEKFGVFKMRVKALETPAPATQHFAIATNNTIKVTIPNGAKNISLTYEGLSDESLCMSEIEIHNTDNLKNLYFKNGNYDVEISNKYSITQIKTYGSSSSIRSGITFSFNDFAYLVALSVLQILYSDIEGDIISLANCPIEIFQIVGTNGYTGTLTSFRKLTELSEFLTYRSYHLSGSLNDFVTSQVAGGRTSEISGISGNGFMLYGLGTKKLAANNNVSLILTWESAFKIACYTGGSTIVTCDTVYVYGYGTQEEAEALFPGKTVIKCD